MTFPSRMRSNVIGSQLVSANIPPPAFDWVSRILLKNLHSHYEWKRRSARARTTGYRSVRETVYRRNTWTFGKVDFSRSLADANVLHALQPPPNVLYLVSLRFDATDMPRSPSCTPVEAVPTGPRTSRGRTTWRCPCFPLLLLLFPLQLPHARSQSQVISTLFSPALEWLLLGNGVLNDDPFVE